MYGVGICGHIASSDYLKNNSLYPHSFHYCLSFVLDIPKSCHGCPVHIFIIMKREFFSVSLKIHSSWLTLSRNNPNPPCKEELQYANSKGPSVCPSFFLCKSEFVAVLLSVLVRCCLFFQSFLSSPFVRQSFVTTSCHMSFGGVI